MTKDYIKQGIDAAEKERQEVEVNKIKNIVKAYLDEIDQKTTKVKELKEKEKALNEEIAVLQKDLSDLKAGRLDKIEERLKNDEIAKKVTLIKITRIDKAYQPMFPWKSPWIIEFPVLPSNPLEWTINCSNSNTLTGVTGTTFANFVSGTYPTNSGTIRL